MAHSDPVVELLKNLNRSVELLIKLELAEIEGERSQKEMILFLDGLGCSSSEIVRLLGVKNSSVHPTLSRARKATKKK